MYAEAAAEARSAFGDGRLYMESFIPNARHVEVQLLADRHGNCVHLFERDCSVQRRYQKLIEEAPAPGLTVGLREELCQAARRIASAIGYENAGTVEFILDQDKGRFYFLEMNTRIQVEHPVTEMTTGIDLVQEQIRVAQGEPIGFSQAEVNPKGHAIECRINAEQPRDDFRPSPGRIVRWEPPAGPGIRVDSHCYAGYTVPPFYDSPAGQAHRNGRQPHGGHRASARCAGGLPRVGRGHHHSLPGLAGGAGRFHRGQSQHWLAGTGDEHRRRPDMNRVAFVDTTLRDAHQSLWNGRMTTAMMLPIAPVIDRVGFEALDFMALISMDWCVRNQRENPWERIRLMSQAMPNTPLIVGGVLRNFGNVPGLGDRVLGEKDRRGGRGQAAHQRSIPRH